MGNKKENLARFGIGTKGFVYCLLGGLTTMAAFNLGGGNKSGSSGSLEFLSKSTTGNIVLVITIIGLVGYVFWRMYQTFMDTEDQGSDAKGVMKRVGYFISGVLYSFLIFTGFKILMNSSDSGGGKESMTETILSKPFGQILVGALALGILINAGYQIYRVYSGKYRKKIKEAGLDKKIVNLLVVTGTIGYTARGIVFAVIAFLFYKAASNMSSSSAGGTEDAFKFLQDSFGTIVMGIIALGLVAYGVFMIIKAKEQEMEDI